MKGVVAALDIGGTKIAGALVADDGSIIRSRQTPTPGDAGATAVLDTAADLVRHLRDAAPAEVTLAGVGVGCAGVIAPTSGTVLSSTDAIAGWAGTEVADELRHRLGLAVFVDNDIHVHALGECHYGDVRCHDLLFVAVGTGVGGSIVLGGQVLRGRHYIAGHLGHMRVPEADGRRCPCGAVGHLEAVASGPAMTRYYAEHAGAPVRGLEDVGDLALSGDATAQEALRWGATALGNAIGGLVNVLSPEAVVVGGGVTGAGDHWWEPMRSTVGRAALPIVADVPVRSASLGWKAPLLGAALLARRAR